MQQDVTELMLLFSVPTNKALKGVAEIQGSSVRVLSKSSLLHVRVDIFSPKENNLANVERHHDACK